MVGRMSVGRRSFNIKKVHEMNESKEINEMDVEICLEIARQFDTEDMTHPPHRDKEAFKEREKEPVIDFESFVTSLQEGGETDD